ncbi:d2315ef9-3bd6-4869-b6cb-cca4f0f209d3 [Sclerotinia trifoliorum]|uniref:D2315ef9-3bd6-4869-b6cb-cca4f0f209d3 n=1 Tax=Sclerotinia trifoliorum TaxID=28548 RepID=A0A8H2VUV0_9HELO|nr:d2315ef9-3bd6-4869-b6cb-cca4f0f209d3 [Sclerotinia trifoliorum]
MGCWSSKIQGEYQGKKISSIISGECNEYSNHRGRSDERAKFHREKELCHSRSRHSDSEERKYLAVDEKPQMKEMTEEDYSRFRDAEEMRVEEDLLRDIRELEDENEFMEREMRGIESEHRYEGRYREKDRDGNYETSPNSWTYGKDDDRSYYSSGVSSMSSMLSVLYESPEES